MNNWNGNRFSIYASEEKNVLRLIEELGGQTNENTDALENKTDLTGDHKGSWQGLQRPTMSEEGLRATVEKIVDEDLPSINASLETIVDERKQIINVTNENYKLALTLMKDGYTFNVIENLFIDSPLIFNNLKNINFICDFTIKLNNIFDGSQKCLIKFVNCENVEFKCKKIDVEMKELFNSDGMNFIVLFTDTNNVNVIDTSVYNAINVGGLSSCINAVNGSKACQNFNVRNLYVYNCRSAVFTQYKNNTIENVKAIQTNDAIIALNSENCSNSYINNCYANYNNAFPLVAIENNAYNTKIENCVAMNTRGLLEIFSLDLPIVNNYPPTKTTTTIKNCEHILDDENFSFNPTVTITTMSFRRGIEKYKNIIIDNVRLINETSKAIQYLYIADSGINGNKVNNLSILNTEIVTTNIKDCLILLNLSANKINIENINIESGTKNIGIRITRSGISINEFIVKEGRVKGLERFLSCDYTYNDFIYFSKIENVRFTDTNALCVNFPNGTITINDYNIGMLIYDYVIGNKGFSRVVYERSLQPPSVGEWFKGDIAINKFNDEEYYYNGTSWIKRIFI